MNNPLKVGVIGVGSLGQWHAKVYASLENAALACVYDTDADRAREVAARYQTRACASLEEFADAVEAASVVVPTNQHAAIASALMRRGIHVLVEKPIAVSVAQAEEMVRIAARHNVILQVGHVERFNPVMGFLEGVLTQPRFIEAIRLAPYPPPRPGLPPRGTDISVVLDLMIHDLEIIRHLVRSPVREIHAVGVAVLSPTEDIANVRLCFESGCVANVTASRISQERMRKIRVFQPDAYVSLDYQNQSGQMLRKTNAGLTREEVPIEKDEPLAKELASFVRCIREGTHPVVTGEHGMAALELAAAICEHIRRGGS